MATAVQPAKKVDFAHWMARAAEEIEHILPELAADPVHDLRVALRRCRSIASSFRIIDFHPAWRRMDRAARTLFRQFGELRDVQVLAEWVSKLGAPDDPATGALLAHCKRREAELRAHVTAAISKFNRQRWAYWSGLLTQRVQRVPVEGAVFQAIALQRYRQAYELHHLALKNRTKVAYHGLRIGLKKLRYVVENFLPARHEEWGDDLKTLQDLLGEVHDLDVLWATAVKNRAFPDAQTRGRWQVRIEQERSSRIERYREMMVGDSSRWKVWRRGLPQGKEVRRAEHERLRTWAAFVGADIRHSQRVERLAGQIATGLVDADLYPLLPRTLEQVKAAAILHGAGGGPKKACRLIGKLAPPSGWTQEEWKIVTLAVRYYRGALPSGKQKRFAALPLKQQQIVRQIAAVLRLADALDRDHSGTVQRVTVHRTKQVLFLDATGFRGEGTNAQAVSAGRYLLESLCGSPVVVRGENGRYGIASSKPSTR